MFILASFVDILLVFSSSDRQQLLTDDVAFLVWCYFVFVVSEQKKTRSTGAKYAVFCFWEGFIVFGCAAEKKSTF